MTAKKLTKLAKRLKIFTFEEFLIMSGEYPLSGGLIKFISQIEKNQPKTAGFNFFRKIPDIILILTDSKFILTSVSIF